MRLPFFAALLLCTAMSPAFALDMPVNSKVDAVTVFPSGAEVTRAASLHIEPGAHTLIFSGLPGTLMPETIRVEGMTDATIEIGSVDAKLETIDPAAVDAQRKTLMAEMQTLNDERQALDQTITDAEYQKSLMQNLAARAFLQPAKEGDAQHFKAEDLGQLVDLVGGKLQALSKLVLDSRQRQRAIDEKLGQISDAMNALAPQDQAQMTVTVHLEADAPADATLRLRYRIADAGWAPIYDARLATPEGNAKPKLEIVRRADVQQATTENWDNVQLTLSTARPTGTTAAPNLEPNLLRPRPRIADADISASMALQDAAPETPAELGKLNDRVQVQAMKNNSEIRQMQAAIETAGFQALYAVPGRISIDNTGQIKKVRIDTQKLDAKLSAVTVPKLDPVAYLTAAFNVAGESPMLPGVVMLYRDGVFMGQGSMPLLAPGEEAKLGFGADDLVKVKRSEIRRQTGEEGILTTAHTDIRSYDITVRNLHDFTLPVMVLDQLPASTAEEIKVEVLPNSTPATEKDYDRKRGVLAWQRDVKPAEELSIRHGFKVSWPETMLVGFAIN